MAIDLIATIAPKNDGAFATHDSKYGLGGWREVETLGDRDAITEDRRRAGMIVYVLEEQQAYKLGDDLTSWEPFSSLLTQQVVYSISVPVKPEDGATVFYQELVDNMSFDSASAKIQNAPEADIVFQVYLDGVFAGTFSFDTDGNANSNITLTEVTAGAALSIVAPANLHEASVFSFVFSFTRI